MSGNHSISGATGTHTTHHEYKDALKTFFTRPSITKDPGVRPDIRMARLLVWAVTNARPYCVGTARMILRSDGSRALSRRGDEKGNGSSPFVGATECCPMCVAVARVVQSPDESRARSRRVNLYESGSSPCVGATECCPRSVAVARVVQRPDGSRARSLRGDP